MPKFHATIAPPGSVNAIDQPQWAQGHSQPFTTMAYAATLSPATQTNNRVVLTGAATIALPATASDGDDIFFWFYASGGSWAVTLPSSAALIIPSSSLLTSPFTVPVGTKTRFAVQFDASRGTSGLWEVVQYINGY